MVKDIIFEHPVIQRNIPNDKVHVEIFKGHNVGKVLQITSGKTSCPCTTVEFPKGDIKGTFEIRVLVDKVGKSGFYSHHITLLFSNKEEIKLNINGKIEQV